MNLLARRLLMIIVVLLVITMGIQIITAKPYMKAEKKNPGNGAAIKRHPDIAFDSSHNLHMVWQAPIGGQYEIFYGVQSDSKEMGIGTDKNPAVRITYTPADSTRPKVAIDPVSDLIYIIWYEDIPSMFPDSEEDPLDESSLFITAKALSEPPGNKMWFPPWNLAAGGYNVVDFNVDDSEFEISVPEAGTKKLKGTIDSDRDGIKDSAEVTAELGFATSWRKADTDDDGLADKVEIIHQFDPLIDDRLTNKASAFLLQLLRSSDLDNDGLTLCQEIAGGFPVTARSAKVLNGGYATYRFYPKDDHSAYLHLGLQINQYKAPGGYIPKSVGYKIDVTVDSGIGYEFSYTGSAVERVRFEISIGPFSVESDTKTDITVGLTVPQPGKYLSDISSEITETLAYRAIVIRSAMIATGAPNYDLFNYKEGRDYVPEESDDITQITENFEISTDPNRADLFVEFDYLVGHSPGYVLFSEAINAFSDAGIILHYKIDDEDIPLDAETSPDDDDDGSETLHDRDEFRDLLNTYRNSEYDQYIHMIFAHKIYITGIGWVYGGALSADTDTDLTHSGIVIADEELQEMNVVHSSLMEKRLKVFVHELGHALTASHEKSTGSYSALVDGDGGADTFNGYNVMRQNALHDDRAGELIRGEGNHDRNLGSTEEIGLPRFSIESVNQLDLTNKLSVDTGRVIDLLSNYV